MLILMLVVGIMVVGKYVGVIVDPLLPDFDFDFDSLFPDFDSDLPPFPDLLLPLLLDLDPTKFKKTSSSVGLNVGMKLAGEGVGLCPVAVGRRGRDQRDGSVRYSGRTERRYGNSQRK